MKKNEIVMLFAACWLLSSCEIIKTDTKSTNSCNQSEFEISAITLEESILKKINSLRDLRKDYADLGNMRTGLIDTNILKICDIRLSQALQLICECEDDINVAMKRMHDSLNSDQINFGKAQHSK